MQRVFSAGVTLVLLLSPCATIAQDAMSGIAAPRTIEGGRPSRRSIRQEARSGAGRNPHLPTITDVTLDAAYENAEIGVKMRYSSTWSVEELMERAPPLTLVMMFLSKPDDGLRQNINLVIEDLPAPLTLEEYTELGIETERELFEDFTIVESVTIPFLGSERAHRIRFVAPVEGNEMTFVQVWLLRGRRAYVWTFADGADTFDDHYPTFERMMDTLTMR